MPSLLAAWVLAAGAVPCLYHAATGKAFSMQGEPQPAAGHHPDVEVSIAAVPDASCRASPTSRLVVVLTEQPAATWFWQPAVLASMAGCHALLAMDVADARFVRAALPGGPAIRVVPAMAATLWWKRKPATDPAEEAVSPPCLPVLFFGVVTARRKPILQAVAEAAAAAGFSTAISAVLHAQHLHAALRAARVVVIPSAYDAPCCVGLHRLCELLHFPHLTVVAEDCAALSGCRSVSQDLVQWFCGACSNAPRVVFVSQESMPGAVVAALRAAEDHQAPVADARPSVKEAADALLRWTGKGDWRETFPGMARWPLELEPAPGSFAAPAVPMSLASMVDG